MLGLSASWKFRVVVRASGAEGIDPSFGACSSRARPRAPWTLRRRVVQLLTVGVTQTHTRTRTHVFQMYIYIYTHISVCTYVYKGWRPGTCFA